MIELIELIFTIIGIGTLFMLGFCGIYYLIDINQQFHELDSYDLAFGFIMIVLGFIPATICTIILLQKLNLLL